MKLRFILSLFAALALSIATFASPITVSNNAQYASKFLEKGIVSSAIFTDTLATSYDAFDLGVTFYAPTSVSTHDFKSALNRTDISGSYTFKSTLVNLTFGDTYKHYNHPGKTGQGDHSELFAKFALNGGIPMSVVTRYDMATRSLNVEAALSESFTVRSFKLTPSAYAGYTDTADQFPHSLKAVKQSNRYYGGGVAVSYPVLGGNLAVGGYVNRSDVSFQNTSYFWTTAYSVKF